MDIESAEILLPCADLAESLTFFTGELGFRLVSIHPAEDPTRALLAGHGLNLRLLRGFDGPAGMLRLRVRELTSTRELLAPNGTRIELSPAGERELPPLAPAFVLARHEDASWVSGRAGMLYRDLIPGRQGGRFIASNIRIPDAGPVPDYTHHHEIRVQLIYCWRGWVRVAYEAQGPAFVLQAGDCVLQPPNIRHRVLESSAGLEVIEFGCPAEHLTFVDHDMALPNDDVDASRRWQGQHFVRHQLAEAHWQAESAGFEARDIGIADATAGLADARVLRASARGAALSLAHARELRFVFVLEGQASLRQGEREPCTLGPGDAASIPPHLDARLSADTSGLQLLQVLV